MADKIKRFLLCLIAVFTMSVSGSIYADDDMTVISGGTSDAESDASENREKRSEAVEGVEFSESDAKEFLKKTGSVDGLDIYYKSKDIDDEIWEKNGGKPEKKSEYTEDQKALADKIDEIKKLGELIAVDPKKGTAVASFEKANKCDEGKFYVSDGGRYIITVDENITEIIGMKYVVSTLDSPNVFISADKITLTLMAADNKKEEKIFIYSADENGMRVYKDDEGVEFAWLSEKSDHFYGIYRYGAENENFRMLVDDRHAIFGLENKETGYIWWSSPLEATQDTQATQLLVDELRSSNMMNYGIPENRNNDNTLRSGTDDCTMTVSDIKNGIRVEYDYHKAGFRFPVEYILEDDHLKASLRISDIEEFNSANIATEITVLGSFGAASDKEDGYFVIPDGSGALIRFNNNRTMQPNAYNQQVYGSDVTVVPTSRGAVTEQVYLPVYGIVKEDNAMLVVASKGDSNASISAEVSKQSNTSYNLCSFTFTLRGTDTYYMSGSSNQRFTVFESGDIKSDDIELLYYPISEEGADFVDVAERYRSYLMDEKGITSVAKPQSSPMYVDLYGGAQKKKPILGIPVTLRTSVTNYEQAQTILEKLNAGGVDSMVVSYNNWTNDGIKNKVDTDAKPSGILGGKKDFEKLTDYISDNGFELYPVTDNRDFYSGNGYYSFTSTAVRVSGAYSRIVSYDRAYGIPDGFKKNMSLLSPEYFNEVFDEVSESYSKAGLDGVSVANLTTSLYGDYGKKSISRYDAMNRLVESYEELNSSLSGGILADSANAYALPYVRHITNVPLSSSRFDIFDEDIPFYQIVMHGLIPYSTTAVNGDADSETLLLMAAATGSNLSYDMLYEETSELKDTEFDIYYYANYANWIETAAAEYRMLEPVLSSVSDCFITDYEIENNGSFVTTTYSNGTVVKVDFEKKTIDFNGKLINVTEYAEEGGIRF